MQLTSQILAFGRIFYAIKQYMQLSDMQLTVQLSYWMGEIGQWFLKFYAINQYMQLSNMQLSDTVCTTKDRSTIHPKFVPTRIWTHNIQIMTVHFMLLRCLL